jgi:hypothetical protein
MPNNWRVLFNTLILFSPPRNDKKFNSRSIINLLSIQNVVKNVAILDDDENTEENLSKSSRQKCNRSVFKVFVYFQDLLIFE